MTNKYPIEDPHFKVVTLSKTDRPNLLCYLAMHQDYSEGYVAKEYDKLAKLSESELGDRLVRNCLKFQHYGVIEHPSITFNVIGFPHSVMVQARTHRVACSFDCMSQRYTSKRILRLNEDLINLAQNSGNFEESYVQERRNLVEEIFYFRPAGNYLDREGNKYYYSSEHRENDILFTENAIEYYAEKVNDGGHAPEHARDMLTQNIRQHFVVTFNARSLLHFCDLRLPKDSQIEIQTMALMVFQEFKKWMPETASYYEQKRMGKNKLAP